MVVGVLIIKKLPRSLTVHLCGDISTSEKQPNQLKIPAVVGERRAFKQFSSEWLKNLSSVSPFYLSKGCFENTTY